MIDFILKRFLVKFYETTCKVVAMPSNVKDDSRMSGFYITRNYLVHFTSIIKHHRRDKYIMYY